jgi:hypothetical protein
MADVAAIIAKAQENQAPSDSEYAALVAAVESPELPINVRVRALPVLSHHVEVNPALLTKVVASLIKLLEDDLQVVHAAVVKALSDLAVTAAKFLDVGKSTELVRDITDVLFQISLPTSGFAPDVRKAAKEAVSTTLPGVNVLGVAVKAVHLLSNERWNDEAEQLELERRGALDLLHQLTSNKNKEQWNEEAETKLLKIVPTVLTVLSAAEVGRFLGDVSHLPSIAAKEGAPLVEHVLKLKLDGPRGLETVAKLRSVLPKEAVNDAIIDKIAPLLTKAKSADPFSTQIARTFVFAARHASAEKAGKHIDTVKKALAKDGHESWTFTEALLASLSILGAKAPEALNELLADDAFRADVSKIAKEASELEAKLIFAAKKAALGHEASLKHSEAIEALKHVVHLGAFIDVKKAPELKPCSWEVRPPPVRAPKTKRVDIDTPLTAQGKRQQPRAK